MKFLSLKRITQAALFIACSFSVHADPNTHLSVSNIATENTDSIWGNAPSVTRVPTLTLKESILRAFARNPDLAKDSAQVGIGQAQVREAQSAWYPQIQATTRSNNLANNNHSSKDSTSTDNSVSYGLTITQLIYDFGKTNNNIALQDASWKSYQYKLMSTLNNVAQKTALAYVQISRYQELCSLATKNIESLKNIQQMAALRANAGLSSSSDVLQAESRIAGMRSTLEDYKAQLRSQETALAVYTGVTTDGYQKLPSELKDQKMIVDSINYNNIPSVLDAQTQQEASKSGVNKARSQYWPTISLQGSRNHYKENSGVQNWDNQVYINVSAPLYQGGSVSAQIDQAEGAAKVAMASVAQVKLDILQQASLAQSDFTGAKGRELAGTKQLESSLKAREVYKNEYKISNRSLNDLLTVEQDVFQAEQTSLMAKYDSWIACVNYAGTVNNLLSLSGVEINKEDNGLPMLK